MLSLLSFVSCSVKERKRCLDTIESSILKDSPDSARVLLESFTNSELSNPAIRAEHALILSEAYERCGIKVMSDTLIRKAIRYYRICWKHSSHLSRAYYCLSQIYENQGHLRKAAEAYLEAEILSSDGSSDSGRLPLFEKYSEHGQELILLVEKRDLKGRYVRQTTILLLGALFVIVTVFLLLLGLRSQKKERERLLLALNELKQEYMDLKNKPVELAHLSKEARIRLGDRLNAIGCFLENPPEELTGFTDSLENVKQERKEILETIGLLFALWFPNYVNYLLEKKLSVSEIGYCSLITLGIQTKMLGGIIQRSSYYKISSSIRKKMGLPANDIKLGTFLREKFSETIA